jgi:hypothetical protein
MFHSIAFCYRCGSLFTVGVGLFVVTAAIGCDLWSAVASFRNKNLRDSSISRRFGG